MSRDKQAGKGKKQGRVATINGTAMIQAMELGERSGGRNQRLGEQWAERRQGPPCGPLWVPFPAYLLPISPSLTSFRTHSSLSGTCPQLLRQLFLQDSTRPSLPREPSRSPPTTHTCIHARLHTCTLVRIHSHTCTLICFLSHYIAYFLLSQIHQGPPPSLVVILGVE